MPLSDDDESTPNNNTEQFSSRRWDIRGCKAVNAGAQRYLAGQFFPLGVLALSFQANAAAVVVVLLSGANVLFYFRVTSAMSRKILQPYKSFISHVYERHVTGQS